jgi:hypothetical protein
MNNYGRILYDSFFVNGRRKKENTPKDRVDEEQGCGISYSLIGYF